MRDLFAHFKICMENCTCLGRQAYGEYMDKLCTMLEKKSREASVELVNEHLNSLDGEEKLKVIKELDDVMKTHSQRTTLGLKLISDEG